jgi:hypothetical protein
MLLLCLDHLEFSLLLSDFVFECISHLPVSDIFNHFDQKMRRVLRFSGGPLTSDLNTCDKMTSQVFRWFLWTNVGVCLLPSSSAHLINYMSILPSLNSCYLTSQNRKTVFYHSDLKIIQCQYTID